MLCSNLRLIVNTDPFLADCNMIKSQIKYTELLKKS